jgi:hypothetical protein
MTSATALYRTYFVDLEEDAQQWRVIAITHSVKRSNLLPPAFFYPDRATAERRSTRIFQVVVDRCRPPTHQRRWRDR